MSLPLRLLRFVSPSFILPLLLASCGDDAGDAAGGGDVVAGGGNGGGSGQPAQLVIEAASAPTRTTIEIDLAGDASAAPTEPASFQIASDHGPLVVLGVAVDAQAGRLTLTTEKQKLGVSYDLTVAAPGNPLDQGAASFPSADSVSLWTLDFETITHFEVTARRVGIGEHVVLYATDDVEPLDVEETIQEFDEKIFPIETQLFRAMPDRDENGRVVILGLDGDGWYAGYFDWSNALTTAEAEELGYRSNEMEMLYVSIPDTEGYYDPADTIPHELNHLLYAEEHDLSFEWYWHVEGIAECAIHAVHGAYASGVHWYLNLPEIGAGKSLVQWEDANFAQYVQAYMFWTYAASRLGGVEAYGDLFDLSGDPAAVGAFFQAELGQSFAEVQLDMLTAAWVQAPTGPHGFEGMIDFGAKPQTLPPSTGAELAPYTGVFFAAPGELAPVGAGPDVRHRGVDAAAAIDDEAPFAAAGGVLVALNTLQDPASQQLQSAGSFPAVAPPAAPAANASARNSAWRRPPPFNPHRRAAFERWRDATRPDRGN